jgi:sec-independent protein translocase protein TatB
MFDVDFTELLVIFVVALVVLGPKRLPGLVSSLGRWVGKARSMARQFREQLESEIQLEEAHRNPQARPQDGYPPPPPEFGGEPPGTIAPPPDAESPPDPGSTLPPDDPSHRDAADDTKK